jgi:hypothetical protein
MGNAFSNGKLTSTSVIDSAQRDVLTHLSTWIDQRYNKTPEGLDQLRTQLLGANSSESKALAERMFSEALMGPALRQFDQQVAPRISEGFASVGGTLSSRRGTTISQALTDVTSNATGQLAQLLPQIQAFPLQQTLNQISGLSALQGVEYQPYQQALQLALSPTRGSGQKPAGAGWEVAGAAGGAVAALAAFSDPALKEDITEVGTKHGLKVYDYRYTTEAVRSGKAPLGRFRGFMADEVAKKYPKAVFRQDGFLMIKDRRFLPKKLEA